MEGVSGEVGGNTAAQTQHGYVEEKWNILWKAPPQSICVQMEP